MAASVRRQHTTSCWSPGTAVCSITTRRWCSPARRVRHDCRAGRQGRGDSGVLRRHRGREVRAPALPRGPFQRAASGAVHDVREHLAALVSWAVAWSRPATGEPQPTVLLIAELDEGPWWWSQLVDADPANLAVGQRLRIEFRRAGPEHEAVPVFALA